MLIEAVRRGAHRGHEGVEAVLPRQHREGLEAVHLEGAARRTRVLTRCEEPGEAHSGAAEVEGARDDLSGPATGSPAPRALERRDEDGRRHRGHLVRRDAQLLRHLAERGAGDVRGAQVVGVQADGLLVQLDHATCRRAEGAGAVAGRRAAAAQHEHVDGGARGRLEAVDLDVRDRSAAEHQRHVRGHRNRARSLRRPGPQAPVRGVRVPVPAALPGRDTEDRQ